MPTNKAFNDVLDEAIADLTEHGYSNPERIAYWMERIRLAAEASMASTADLDDMLRRAMFQVYQRMIEQGVVLKHHPGIKRFAIDRVRPEARAELDRRILASADLIKLNRKEAIEKTLRRFSGWSTSIPKGGSETVDRREVKQSLKKPMQRLSFEERRVLVDQGHKLRSNVSETIALDNRALAGIWHSHWRQPGYDYREDHKEVDLHIFAVKENNWAIEKGLMKPGPDGFMEDFVRPAEKPFCRCYYQWIYNLDTLFRLAPHMLTEKGIAELKRVEAVMA